METKYNAWHSFLKEQIALHHHNSEMTHINKQLLAELEACAKAPNGEEELYERFYKDVEFGTGGLRGILGVGTNRMNLYTVGKATQGMAHYIQEQNPIGARASVAIAYDSRVYSWVFATTAAEVLAANNIDVYLYDELMPTPALSFAVRHFKCSMGIMITASHNPAKYNGYKVYDGSGCQVTLQEAEAIYQWIQKVDIFRDVKIQGCSGRIKEMGDSVKEAYLEAVQEERALCTDGDKQTLANLCVVYTPLNGAGNKPVRKILDRIGVVNVMVVKEQELPDGNFPTCPYPNPEKKEALELGLRFCNRLAKEAVSTRDLKNIPDLLLATDPDCDRVGIAARCLEAGVSQYKLLNGNEVGVLLLDFLIHMKVKTGLKKNPVVVKTIVTTQMVDAIAEKHGINVISTLTGFKFIGEQIAFLEEQGRKEEYLLGFEESYGYLSGTYVRDKDAVNGAMLICEMAAYYKEKGMTLFDRLEALFQEYGYYKDALIDFTFEGSKGMETMKGIMERFRKEAANEIIGKQVIEIADYQSQVRNYPRGSGCCGMAAGTRPTGLPQSDVIAYILEDGCGFTVRPSGTEPKLKIYLSAWGKTHSDSENAIAELQVKLTNIVNSN